MESAILRIENLTAAYGENVVLKGIDMSITKNSVVAIMGPSGCGKTTFIRCINRMHELTHGIEINGDIFLNDENIYDMDAILVRRKIGMVFQKPNPFPTMSIYDNVISGYILNGIKLKKEKKDKIVEGSLRKAYLWEEVKGSLHKKGTFLSGGQQQRLCIARALAVEPEVLLMDEPTSALDPTATARIEELIQELKKRYTIVIVTHNMQQAARISNYTAFFMLGELVEYDITTKMFTKPSKKVTEDYVTGRFG